MFERVLLCLTSDIPYCLGAFAASKQATVNITESSGRIIFGITK